MAYRINISKRGQKQFNRLPQPIQAKMTEKIRALATTPRPNGVVKIVGSNDEYRIRVGSYRILYKIDDSKEALEVLQCQHRSEVYKDKS